MGVSPVIAMRMAFGTSLLVILPTAISGTLGHDKRKAIRWKTALVLGSCGLLGALLGATLAAQLPGKILEVGFGGLILGVTLRMDLGVMPKLVKEAEEPGENFGLMAAWRILTSLWLNLKSDARAGIVEKEGLAKHLGQDGRRR